MSSKETTLEFVLGKGEAAEAVVPPSLYLDAALEPAVRLYCLLRGIAASRDTWRQKIDVANALGWSRSKLYRNATLLETAGWLERETDTLSGGGKRSTWRVHRLPSCVRSDTEAKAEVSPVTLRPKSHQRDFLYTFTPQEPPHKDTQPVQIKDDFEEWYQGYPRKIGKGAARRAFASALKKTSAEELTAGLKRFAQSAVGQDPKFIAHPSTWLNGERWLDDADTEAPSEAYTALAESYPGPRPHWSASAFRSFLEAEELTAEFVAGRVAEFVQHKHALGHSLPPLGVLFDPGEKPLSDQNLDGLREAATHRQRTRRSR